MVFTVTISSDVVWWLQKATLLQLNKVFVVVGLLVFYRTFSAPTWLFLQDPGMEGNYKHSLEKDQLWSKLWRNQVLKTFQVNTREGNQIWCDPGLNDHWYGRPTIPTGRTMARSTQHLKYSCLVKTRRGDDVQSHEKPRKSSRRKGSGGWTLRRFTTPLLGSWKDFTSSSSPSTPPSTTSSIYILL